MDNSRNQRWDYFSFDTHGDIDDIIARLTEVKKNNPDAIKIYIDDSESNCDGDYEDNLHILRHSTDKEKIEWDESETAYKKLKEEEEVERALTTKKQRQSLRESLLNQLSELDDTIN